MARYEITNIPGSIDFECSSERAKRIVQNAKNLLMCRMGEIPFDRRRGFNPALYDLPLEEMQNALMPEIDRMMRWEWNAEAVSADATIEDGQTVIRVIIEIDDNLI